MTTKQRKHFVRATIIGFLAAIIIGVFGLYEVMQYNESVLDIYAEQQDSYVKLVLDQINLQQNRTDEEIIDEILNSLVTSDKKYWTLTKEEDILYVKDVSETNRYKGFTSDSYYLSVGGKQFVDSLQTDHVTHAIITIDGDKYVASGTKFSYMGGEYKICLLTYKNVILDNNNLLQTRIMICIILFALLLILLVVIMVCTQIIDQRNAELAKLKEHVIVQNKTVESLEDKLKMETSYNASTSIFHESVLEKFFEKLEERKIKPLTLAIYRAPDSSVYKSLFQKLNKEFGKKYLKITLDDEMLLLIFLYKKADEMEAQLRQIGEKDTAYLGAYTIEDDYNSYQYQFEKFRERIKK